MKKTRNLFILIGEKQEVERVIGELEFKGITAVRYKLTRNEAVTIFNNNKSIICTSNIDDVENFQKIHKSPIYIGVTNGSKGNFLNCIDVSQGNVVQQFQNIAKSYNCDIGDHKSNSSGINGKPTKRDCAYCNLFAGKEDEKYAHRNILYSSANFKVIATVGQFVDGYLLIIPNSHSMSLAELSYNERQEFLEVLEDVKYILNLTYGCNDFLVWENGTGNYGKGKAKDSIVHAHVHIAPSNLTAKTIQQNSSIMLKEIKYVELPNFKSLSYLLIAGENNEQWFINNNPNVYIPRQFIRQVLAEEKGLGDEMWNWRSFPFLGFMHNTEITILQTLKKNRDKLPKRILTNTENYIAKHR